MILTCPACATRYVIGDDVFQAGAREVRCARCSHRWTSDGSDAVDEVDARMDLQKDAPAAGREAAAESPPDAPAEDQVGFGLNDMPGLDRGAAVDDDAGEPADEPDTRAAPPVEEEPVPERPARQSARPVPSRPEPPVRAGRRRTPLWVWFGWLILLGCIAGLAAALVLMRGPLVEAWPPLQRLYDTVGTVTAGMTEAAHEQAPAVALAVEKSELQDDQGKRQLNLLIRLTNLTADRQELPIAVVDLLRANGETEKTERIRLPADQPLAPKESRVMALRLSDVPATVTDVRARSEAGSGH